MTWQLVMVTNLAAAAAYAVIAYLIVTGLVRSEQLRSNHLGLATGLIFVTAAVHHGLLGLELLLPSLGAAKAHGLALRDAWTWHTVVWDGLTAATGVYYLWLRRSRGTAPASAQMFEDLRIRERQALELNDNIVQGLTVAKYAMTIGAHDQTERAIEDTLVRARAIITDLLGEPGSDADFGPGDLRRVVPATLAGKEPPAA